MEKNVKKRGGGKGKQLGEKNKGKLGRGKAGEGKMGGKSGGKSGRENAGGKAGAKSGRRKKGNQNFARRSEHNTKVTAGWDDIQQPAAERLCVTAWSVRVPDTMAADFSGPVRKENLRQRVDLTLETEIGVWNESDTK